jgi:formylglycine-generating enzyme
MKRLALAICLICNNVGAEGLNQKPEINFITLPTGCFYMGFWYPDDPVENRYQVCIKNQFQISQYEITNAQFREFAHEHNSGHFMDLPLNQDQQPVVNVTWQQATDYAHWLSQKTGETYRLPSEAEWEYAARGGVESEFYWGDDIDTACQYSNIGDITGEKSFTWIIPHECNDHYVVSAPVGQFKPNQQGLYDMIGNVWEWVCSPYADPYDGSEQKCATSGETATHIMRGGGWATRPDFLGPTVRRPVSPVARQGQLNPTLKGSYLGIRLVREIKTKKSPD